MQQQLGSMKLTAPSTVPKTLSLEPGEREQSAAFGVSLLSTSARVHAQASCRRFGPHFRVV